MYHANVRAGSGQEKTELWLSSMEHQMAFFKQTCLNCHIDGGWDPSTSNSSGIHEKAVSDFVEHAQVYNQSNDGRNLDLVTFTGS
jgi:hypothetical protein